MDLEAYDPALAPAPFGLTNTGATCYLNAFLQALASCTAFTRAVLQNRAYLGRTATGAAVYAYVAAYAAADAKGVYARAAPRGIEMASDRVLRALVADLAARRPHVRFGGGQESASEALLHILDMMDPPTPSEAKQESPITRLFIHRFRYTGVCCQCRAVVSTTEDYAININLFYIPPAEGKAADVAAFSEAVRRHETAVPDYACPTCARRAAAAGPPPPRTQLVRVHRLAMAPEILVCAFNIYAEHRAHNFPGRLEFPAEGAPGDPAGARKTLGYRLVAQVEHAGALTGGHYWARALRRETGPDGPRLRAYELNDSSAGAAVFGPTPNTYMVFYHCTGVSPVSVSKSGD